jgi:hypothetical protein
MASRDIVGRRTKELCARDIHKLIKGLGRCVTIYRPDAESDCPNCYYDAINRQSTGRYNGTGSRPFTVGRCPVCRGRGTLTTKRKRDIHALVTWRPKPEGMMQNSTQFTPGGKASETVVRLKTKPCHLALIRDCQHAMIDGLKCVLVEPPTIRGLGSRSVLIALFVVEEKYRPGETI